MAVSMIEEDVQEDEMQEKPAEVGEQLPEEVSNLACSGEQVRLCVLSLPIVLADFS